MLGRKRLYLKVQKIHHKTLKVIYQSNETYKELLELSETVSIHQGHLRFLVTEVYKITSYLSSKFMCSLFLHKKRSYNIMKVQVLLSPPARSTYYGTNSLNLQTSLVWNSWPSYIMLHEIFFSFLFYYIKRLVLNEVINKNKMSLSMSCDKNLVSLLSSFVAIC